MRRALCCCLLAICLLSGVSATPFVVRAVPAPPPPQATFQLAGDEPGYVAAATACGVWEQTAAGVGWERISGDFDRTVELVSLFQQGMIAIGLRKFEGGQERPELFRRNTGAK